ncbi:MAG: molybdopterin biosynthesis protein [Anaerovoracaceae bacterium]|jgi:putative molybdopterin biosynthesis protein
MGKRNLYLHTIPVDEAQEKYRRALAGRLAPSYEDIAVTDALHRITKEAIYARCSSPLYNASAMDGIAVIAAHTTGATEVAPKTLREGEDYVVVDTGDPVRAPYDAVIMAEDLVETADGVTITAAAAPWQHVRPVGEDIVAGEMILPGGHRIRPIDIGVLLSAGITRVTVVRRPRAAIFPTGDEIVEAEEVGDDPAATGAIIESNSRMFENMVREAGGLADRYPTLPDDRVRIRDAVQEALRDHDLVLINAGSSAGRDDYTVHVLRELGEVIVHGVAIKPGKPVILAIVDDKPVIGLPGYPVSAYLGFVNFVSPLLAALSGDDVRRGAVVDAVISRRLVSSLKHREYVRVKVGRVGERMVAAPLARGAGAAMSLVRADGFCVIPQNSEGVEAGDTVRVELYRELEEVENTVVVIGSHDLILDVMADLMPNRFHGMFLSSTHVGSMAGLMALRRGECHVTPTHLLDEKSGTYNVPVLRQLFGTDGRVTLVKGVGRTQGIMVKKGNPLGITGIADLAGGVRYVNRQRGAGTRVLFDYRLRQEGLRPEDINGYDREATTHMAVAAAVAGDGADAGMGVYSAAGAMDLDFLPIADEEYDFAIPTAFLELPHIRAFLELLGSSEFRSRVEELGGYTFRCTGECVPVK